MVELIDLDPADLHQLIDEAAIVSKGLKQLFNPDKINVAALGNQVRQLHMHVIARFVSDEAWPQPVFGRGARQPYPHHSAGALGAQITGCLKPLGMREANA
jgi:diadenosine tetraphosphate (Ap4A) HIT family hydrolase